MPPVSASGTALKTSSASRAGAQRAEQQQEDQAEARPARRSVSRCRAAAKFSNCPPQASQYPAAVSPRSAICCCASVDQRADIAAAHIGRHDDPALAVLAADLVGPLGTRRRSDANVAQRNVVAAAAAIVALGRQRNRKISSASMSARSSSASRTTIWKRRSPSNTSPASRPPIAVPITSWTSAGSGRGARSPPCRC